MGYEFSEEFTISYFGTDNDLKLTPSSLAVYFQDLAIAHSNELGYTLDYLGNLHRGWAITNWHIVIKRFPQYGEKIKIVTWSNYCKKMQAQRFFRVEDDNGDIICTAASRWIFMDLEKRKPLRITPEMEEAYVCNIPSPIENEKYLMPKAIDESKVTERLFTVTRRDTDTNGHTNNTKYIEWAIDDVPDDIYLNSDVEDMRVVYRKECYKGDSVISRCYVEDLSAEKKQVFSYFLDGSAPAVIFAEVVTIWKVKK